MLCWRVLIRQLTWCLDRKHLYWAEVELVSWVVLLVMLLLEQ